MRLSRTLYSVLCAMYKLYILCTGGAYYVPEPYSFLLIPNKFLHVSFVLGGKWPEQIKFLFAPAPPPPTVWALKPPS